MGTRMGLDGTVAPVRPTRYGYPVWGWMEPWPRLGLPGRFCEFKEKFCEFKELIFVSLRKKFCEFKELIFVSLRKKFCEFKELIFVSLRKNFVSLRN